MVVMSRTESEYATARVPASVWVAAPRHVEDLDQVDTMSKKLGSGKAFLKVVAYPWGVELDVCDVEEGE